MEGYHHTQESPLCVLFFRTAVVLLVGALFTLDKYPAALILGGGGALAVFLWMAFYDFAIEDQGAFLAIRFGLLPLFRRKVQYTDIEKAEVGRTMILDGWGIHYRVGGGWVWNLWGRACVVIHFKNGSVLRIGTDDAEKLSEFLERKRVT